MTESNEAEAFSAGAAQYEINPTETTTSSVTHVYYDQRRYDEVHVEGNLRTRDFAGRDFSTLKAGRRSDGTRRPLAVVSVAQQELSKLSLVAVRVPSHDIALEKLHRDRFVVVQGPSGVGKSAAALLLLGLDNTILGVDPSLTVRDLLDLRQITAAESGNRYVVESMAPTTATQLSTFIARRLTRDLTENDSFLVVTIDNSVSVPEEFGAHVVRWLDRPDPLEVLRSHLSYRLPQDEVVLLESDYCLEDLRELLEERRIGEIDSVAEAMVSAQKSSTPMAVLLEKLGYEAAVQIADWFKTQRSAEDVGLIVATAVLGGCSFATVAAHARVIEDLFVKLARPKARTRRRDALRPRSQLARDTLAVVEQGYVETDIGPCAVDTIRLKSRWHVQGLLELVWQEYPFVANALLAWLRNAGQDPDPAVRLRVAITVGYLAKFDFVLIRQSVLTPWSAGPTEAARAAADALGQAAYADTSAPLALSLLDSWASEFGNYDEWWTAAAAYGGEFGVRFPSVALDRLLEIVLKADPRAPWIVAESVVRLFGSGGRFLPALAEHVLTHLMSWLSVEPLAAATARVAFAELHSRATDPDWPGSRRYRQTLLAETCREPVAGLMRDALNTKETRDWILRGLRRSLTLLDNDDEGQVALGELLGVVATGAGSRPIDRERLLHYLDRWAQEADPIVSALRIADRLREVVTP